MKGLGRFRDEGSRFSGLGIGFHVFLGQGFGFRGS